MSDNSFARFLRRLADDGRLWWLALILPVALFLPALPIDETRYLAVAWEMRLHLDFLVPHLNGAPYSKNWLRHEDLFGGNATLAFEMGPEPNKNWGSSPEDLPQSMCDETFEN